MVQYPRRYVGQVVWASKDPTKGIGEGDGMGILRSHDSLRFEADYKLDKYALDFQGNGERFRANPTRQKNGKTVTVLCRKFETEEKAYFFSGSGKKITTITFGGLILAQTIDTLMARRSGRISN